MSAGSGVICQAVHGLGGVGKTELALQYAHRWRDRYPVRWWVNAESRAAIETGLATLTARLNPDLMMTTTATEAAAWAIGWLQNQSGWLLVLDNVEQRSDVEPLLAQLDSGHVLITTRRDVNWEVLVDGCLRLDKLDREAAVRVLLERGGQSDQLAAAVLADELGYLPLALQQAAGYLRQTRLSASVYLERLRAQPAQVLNTIAEGDQAERAVAQVWMVTLNRLRDERPVAIDLLRILSCYAADDVPRDVLATYADEPAVVDQALSALASYNLITLAETTVSTHRLLQSVIRTEAQTEVCPGEDDGRQESLWQQVVRRAMELLEHSCPSGNPSHAVDTWPRWKILAPHVESLAEHIPDGTADLTLAYLLGELAVFYDSQAGYQQSLRVQRRALEITEAARPAGHPDIAVRLDNLAYTLSQLGRPEEALPLQRRAVKISESALPAGDPDIAIRLDNLACTLAALGWPEEALPLHRRALEITESALPAGHRSIAIRLDNLAHRDPAGQPGV
ncbi:tetratricopeptide repeat protein, partial [Micromonospora sp. STR1_7]|nr:tetratricopeptide repeat protein [Micromonospora parastrephiae]